MSIKRIILKEFKQVSEEEIILTPEDTLFHGTVESFKPDELTTGGYDNILWTTTSSLIAQTYIPVSGITSFLNTDYFIKPKEGKHAQALLKQLGIIFEDVEFQGNQPVSWRATGVFEFEKEYEYNEKLYTKIIKLSKQIDADKDYDRKLELREKRDKLGDKLHDTEILKRRYVNKKLKELGYKPSNKYYEEKYSWEIKTKGDKIMPASWRETGRLFILKPKTELKLFDLTYGESREPDLIDVDYHAHELFQAKEKKGYDGIKITDFAQEEIHGNVGHMSYGIFKSALDKIDIYDIIKAHHPTDFGKRTWELRTNHSKEYEEYLK